MAHTNSYKRKNRHGEVVDRKSYYWMCFCPESRKERVSPTCPRTIRTRKADDIAWRKVFDAVRKPDVLLREARLQVA